MAGAAGAVAMFGSCPTIYSFDGNRQSLEAEAFFYSISPLFEAEDLDRMDNGRPSGDQYVLQVKNEAFETHYIDEMKLITVDHSQGYEAFPADS